MKIVKFWQNGWRDWIKILEYNLENEADTLDKRLFDNLGDYNDDCLHIYELNMKNTYYKINSLHQTYCSFFLYPFRKDRIRNQGYARACNRLDTIIRRIHEEIHKRRKVF